MALRTGGEPLWHFRFRQWCLLLTSWSYWSKVRANQGMPSPVRCGVLPREFGRCPTITDFTNNVADMISKIQF